MSTTADDILTTTEAAEYLSVHPDTIVRWARAGRVPFTQVVGRGWMRFRRSDLDNLLPSRPEVAS